MCSSMKKKKEGEGGVGGNRQLPQVMIANQLMEQKSGFFY